MDLMAFEMELLASLPPAPNGLSPHELADGLLDGRAQAFRAPPADRATVARHF